MALRILPGFASLVAARLKSRALYQRLNPPADAQTQFLFRVRFRPRAGDWVLMLRTELESLLPAADAANLIDDDGDDDTTPASTP